jgi:hypothetical protein
MTIVILSEDSFVDRDTINGRELHALTETARLFGCAVYPLPPNFEVCETAENAFAYVPNFDPLVPGVWFGYIPTIERYTAIYRAALIKGIQLVNTPIQYQMAMEFDRFYPLLGELTPKSLTFGDLQSLASIDRDLGYPVFIKGAIKSDKEQGWKACVANNVTEATTIARSLLAREYRSRGKIIVRQLVKLRSIVTDYQDFPLGREYRLFVYRDRILARGFYWDEYADPDTLDASEAKIVEKLALEVARRVGTPYIAIDIGQLESGDWIVIEVGDAQFSGLSRVSILELLSKLSELSPQSQ